MELNELLTQYEVSTGLHNLPTADEISAMTDDERKKLSDKLVWRLGRNVSTTVGYNVTIQGRYTDMGTATKSELYQAIIDLGTSTAYTYSVSLSGAEHVVMNPVFTYAIGGSTLNTTLEVNDASYVISYVTITNGNTVLPTASPSSASYVVSVSSVEGNVSIVAEESYISSFSSAATVNKDSKKQTKKVEEKTDNE